MECGGDRGPVVVRNGFAPLLAHPLVRGYFVQGRPVEAGVISSTGVEEGFDGVGVGFGDLPSQAPAFGILVEAHRHALLVAVAKLDRADVGTAGFLSAVSRCDRGKCGHVRSPV